MGDYAALLVLHLPRSHETQAAVETAEFPRVWMAAGEVFEALCPPGGLLQPPAMRALSGLCHVVRDKELQELTLGESLAKEGNAKSMAREA